MVIATIRIWSGVIYWYLFVGNDHSVLNLIREQVFTYTQVKRAGAGR
jgi:hypothetical protein